MKKIFTLFAAAVFAAGMAFADGSYGIAVNGTTYYAGTENPSPGDPSFKEFMVLGLSLNAGDKFQLWDPSGNDGKGAGWAVDLDGASVSAIKRDGDHYECSEAGCFDFYIKLKYGADQLYVGAGGCGTPTGTPISGGDNPGGGQGGGQGGGTSDDAYWYWKGYVDGVDLNNEIDGGLFDGGISEITVNDAGYIFVVYQVHDVPGVQYMAPTYSDATHSTMTTSGVDKLKIPAGTYTLYLYDNGDGTVELSREPLAGKTLVGGGKSAVENTTIQSRVTKTIINGQVVILKDGVRYNLLGSQLQ